MRVFIMRHAESYSNTQGKMMSTTDLPLTEKGIKQAAVARSYLSCIIYPNSFVLAFSSPLLRAKQTADIIVNQDINITESDLLKEMNLGEMEGLTWNERAMKYPDVDMENALAEAKFPNG